jgi:hypothetical protein
MSTPPGPLALLRTAVGAGLILFQAGMIVYARFDDARYFCWAPHDVMWTFQLEVEIDGRVLDTRELRQRYRMRRGGFQEHSIVHAMREIAQYESTHGKHDNARVRMTYRKNNGPEQVWRWPDQP